jgi:hypothetical protein
MEDFLSQDSFAGRAAHLIEHQQQASTAIAAADLWQQAAEDCVLARLRDLRVVGGLPRHKTPLSTAARRERLKSLLKLWANGCTCALDEDLLADIVNRHAQGGISRRPG